MDELRRDSGALLGDACGHSACDTGLMLAIHGIGLRPGPIDTAAAQQCGSRCHARCHKSSDAIDRALALSLPGIGTRPWVESADTREASVISG